MTDYTGPDLELIPVRDVLFCEHCGATYGNCRHHPIESHHKPFTLAELKEALDQQRNSEWDQNAIRAILVGIKPV
jgi:hypothetical protein